MDVMSIIVKTVGFFSVGFIICFSFYALFIVNLRKTELGRWKLRCICFELLPSKARSNVLAKQRKDGGELYGEEFESKKKFGRIFSILRAKRIGGCCEKSCEGSGGNISDRKEVGKESGASRTEESESGCEVGGCESSESSVRADGSSGGFAEQRSCELSDDCGVKEADGYFGSCEGSGVKDSRYFD